MFYPGWLYKNTKSNIQFIPMSCTLSNDGVTAFGYLFEEKSDNIILKDYTVRVKTKEYPDWVKQYEYFKHN